jgi:ADP-heptose:LPS heptosyltransferase
MTMLRDFVTLLVYRCVQVFASISNVKPRQNVLLLVKTDEIGDYILFRNLLATFHRSEKYKDHQIIFVGNAICKQLFEAYDHDKVHKAIWLNKKSFKSDMRYRLKFLKEIKGQGATTAINLIFSRNIRTDDTIVAASGAAIKVAMQADPTSQNRMERLFTPDVYTTILQAPNIHDFESIRNADFVGRLLTISTPSPSIHIELRTEDNYLNVPGGKYSIVFPGSGRADKKWPPQKFAKVAEHLHNKFKQHIILAGGPGDVADVAACAALLNVPYTDMANKTSLPQFANLLSKAECLVSVDTGAVHLAAAVRCPVFALFSGKHYGRFSPYPQTIAKNFFSIYPEPVEQEIKSGIIGSKHWDEYPNQAIETIDAAKLIKSIDGFFDKSLSA